MAVWTYHTGFYAYSQGYSCYIRELLTCSLAMVNAFSFKAIRPPFTCEYSLQLRTKLRFILILSDNQRTDANPVCLLIDEFSDWLLSQLALYCELKQPF